MFSNKSNINNKYIKLFLTFIKNKKCAEISSFAIFMAVALILAVVFIYIYSNQAGVVSSSIGSTSEKSAIDQCNSINSMDLSSDPNARSREDSDNDGIIDDCDVCTIKVDKQKLDEYSNDFTGTLKSRILSSVNDYSLNDIDKDFIFDGCDSDTSKKPKKILGLFYWGDPRKDECYRVANLSGGHLYAHVFGGKSYVRCILRDVE